MAQSESGQKKAGLKNKLYGGLNEQREDTIQYVLFNLGDERFAAPLSGVREILGPREITDIPFTSGHLSGILNLRGRIVAVVDLRTRFGFAPAVLSMKHRIIIADYKSQTVGMIVDSVPDVVTVPKSLVARVSPLIAGGLGNDFFAGTLNMEGGVVAILDIEKALGNDAERFPAVNT